MDQSDFNTDYPFKCDAVIRTGHTANIFNAQMLPFSTRIATVAGDKQVRVFDIGAMAAPLSGSETIHQPRDTCIRVIRCHGARTKRIVAEESSDLFLTVAEDGTVRQHDLRTPQHACYKGECLAPLVKMPHDLSTLAMSPLTPYQFVVGGESAFAHLFDRRQLRRTLRAAWGISSQEDELTTCVRRFGRNLGAPRGRSREDHITGARMASSNGHEVLLSYSSDAVYLYSTQDEPGSHSKRPSPILSPNEVKDTINEHIIQSIDSSEAEDKETDLVSGCLDDGDSEGSDGSGEATDSEAEMQVYDDVPIIYPRARFTGHCNSATVKDVNFVGPNDDFVVSGSDDGNFFMWRKDTGTLHGIYEGDGSVVNVIEAHPHLPLLAVSGIDTTVKLFAPSLNPSSEFSRMSNSESIMDRNSQASRQHPTRSLGIDLIQFVLRHEGELRALRMADREDDGDHEATVTCPTQ
ncbi:hypothetical protein HWV62_40545 [Athelia sp. TMB]|nr:hypothetical protein HWV62_40545 [Athelia sp. TMB]